MLGTLGLVFGLSYLASYLAYDWPQTPIPCFVGSVLGAGFSVVGNRIAGKTWSGSTQVPHRAAALAGLLFLGMTGHLYLQRSITSISQSGWVMLALSLVAIVTWFVRARARRSRKRKISRYPSKA